MSLTCINCQCTYYSDEWKANCANIRVKDIQKCDDADVLLCSEEEEPPSDIKEALQEFIDKGNEKLVDTVDPKSTYYDEGGIEVIEVIKAKLTPEQYQGFLLGNVIKYICRANWKDKFSRDIEKIGVYTKMLGGK